MFPIVIRRPVKGANARNWPGLVILDPEARFPAAIVAQEAWEAIYKLNPFTLLVTRLSRSARRRMEIMGHEVEVQAAALIYGKVASAYRGAEARSMHAGYDGLFAGHSVIRIEAAMEAVSDEANRWVRRNIQKIERWK